MAECIVDGNGGYRFTEAPMILHKPKSKNLDSWLGRKVKVVLNSSDGYYEGTLLSEQKNGILLEASNEKRIYIQYDSIVSFEEL